MSGPGVVLQFWTLMRKKVFHYLNFSGLLTLKSVTPTLTLAF